MLGRKAPIPINNPTLPGMNCLSSMSAKFANQLCSSTQLPMVTTLIPNACRVVTPPAGSVFHYSGDSAGTNSVSPDLHQLNQSNNPPRVSSLLKQDDQGTHHQFFYVFPLSLPEFQRDFLNYYWTEVVLY